MTNPAQDKTIATWLHSVETLNSDSPVEHGIALIEEAARILERTDLQLEQTLLVYEKSVAVTALLQKKLAEARQKIEILLPGGGTEPAQLPDL